MTLPRIGNSLEINSVSDRGTKKRSNNMGAKSVDQPRIGTIPLAESLATDENQLVNLNSASLRDSAEQAASFDTKKWKRIINGNVEMI